MKIIRPTLGRAAVLAGLSAACVTEPPPPEPDFEIETERVILRGFDRHEDELCGGTVAWIDESIDSLAPWFDLAPGNLGVYNWYSRQSWTESPCPKVGGCVWRPQGVANAHSQWVPFDHEIVHMASVYCIHFLVEGLAEHLRGPQPAPGKGELDGITIEDAIAASLGEGEWSFEHYDRSRHFVSFLAYRYGLDAVIDLCSASPRLETTREEFEQATLEILGDSLDQVLVEYAEYPECPEEQDRAKIFECGRAPIVELALDSQVTIHREDLSCAHPEAVGPRGDFYHLSYTIRLIEDGNFTAHPDFLGVDQTGLVTRFEQCGSCGDGAAGYVREWDGSTVDFGAWYEEGLYVLDVQIPMHVAGELEIRLNR